MKITYQPTSEGSNVYVADTAIRTSFPNTGDIEVTSAFDITNPAKHVALRSSVMAAIGEDQSSLVKIAGQRLPWTRPGDEGIVATLPLALTIGQRISRNVITVEDMAFAGLRGEQKGHYALEAIGANKIAGQLELQRYHIQPTGLYVPKAIAQEDGAIETGKVPHAELHVAIAEREEVSETVVLAALVPATNGRIEITAPMKHVFALVAVGNWLATQSALIVPEGRGLVRWNQLSLKESNDHPEGGKKIYATTLVFGQSNSSPSESE